MNMVNKCAKFHEHSPKGKKVKFNLPSAIGLSETATLCTTLYRNLKQVSNSGGLFDQPSLEVCYEIFTEDASVLPLHHGAKKVQNDQKLKSRWGPALIFCSKAFMQKKTQEKLQHIFARAQ